MKKEFNQGHFTGERALFKQSNSVVNNSIFEDGESPLKESKNIEINDSIFKWKYPLWYCDTINVRRTTLLETARSGIWYTNNIKIEDSIIQAPKTFRRGKNIDLIDVYLPNADETLWNCENISLTNVQAKGDYFGLNSKHIVANNLSISGNYAFDGAENIQVYNSKLLSKDAFWNCKDVTVIDSVIIGEYLGWNSSNLRFVNCYIESNQGLCYVKDLVIEDGKLINTRLAFEYSTIDVDVSAIIDSVKNPISGKIKAKNIGEIIMDDGEINSHNTSISIDSQFVKSS